VAPNGARAKCREAHANRRMAPGKLGHETTMPRVNYSLVGKLGDNP